MRRVKRKYKEIPMSLGIKERPDGGAEWFLDNHKPREGNIKSPNPDQIGRASCRERVSA